MVGSDTLDVIVRFHDLRRLSELDRCIFSLVGQRYRPLHIYLVAQRFTPTMIAEMQAALAPLLAVDDAPSLSVLNWASETPTDARAMLLNLGLDAVKGRFLAFLDYDDAIYPEAYDLLIARLRAAEAAIAFGGICIKVADRFGDIGYVKEKQHPFTGRDLRDLFHHNFCPIHSFVIDRRRVPSQFLSFDTALTHAEDYDFLLRLCASFTSDFRHMNSVIGDYYYKTDGSNTINTEWCWSEAVNAEWQRAEDFLQQRRRITPLSAEVQRGLGLVPVAGLTVADVLALPRGRTADAAQ